MPLASNVNVPSAGYTVANQVIARVTNGRVSVYSFERTDVIVDVTGYMTGATAPAGSDGLFVPITPARLLDTRTPGPASSGQPIGSGATLTLPITGRGGVPGSGVQSVALNVTATRTQAPGYVTTWPANTPITDTSSLNYVAAGRSVPNHVVAPINGGAVSFYSFGGTDLLVDVMGYWLDATAVAPGTGGAVVSVNTHHAAVDHDCPRRHRRPTAPTASSTRAHRSRSPPRTDGGTRVRRSGTWPTSTGRPSRWSIR